MRSILQALIGIAIVYSPLSAQNWDLGPVPPEAAQALAGSPGNMVSVQEIEENYRAAALPLRDGVNTILVEGRGPGECGAQNCPAYLLEKNGTGYRLLLDAHSIQQLHILNSVTNGYHDIQTNMHGSATASDLVIYRYRGKKYQRTDCFPKEYLMIGNDANGLPMFDKKPKLTRTCGIPRQPLRPKRPKGAAVKNG